MNSSWKHVTSGVSQGSVLGPLLFLMYVDDMDDVIHRANLVKFADDTKLYFSYDPSSVSVPVSPLNDDLSRFSEWCTKWRLRLNFEKCHCLYIGSSNPRTPVCLNDNSYPIESCESVCDLGVWLTTDLKPSLNCKRAALKGQRMLTLIKIAFRYLSPSLLCTLYKAFVRPILEYCSSAWCPYNVKDIEVL